MTAPLFLGFVAALAALLCALAAWRFPARRAIGFAAALAIWLVYVGALGRFGVIADPSRRPPGIAYIVVPVFLFVLLVVLRSAAGGRAARAIPPAILIGLQTYRVGVELFLNQLWVAGLVPRMLTFEGANIDILIGMSAPVVAWLSTLGGRGRRAALVWNGLGLLALANVIVRSALTAPGPLNLLPTDPANLAIGTFPYTFIAGFFAPLAVVLHVLAIRALRAGFRDGPQSSVAAVLKPNAR